MSKRNLKAHELTEAVRDYAYSKAATDLSTLSLKYVESGADRHLAADLANELPLIVAMHVRSSSKWDRSRDAYDCEHSILLSYFRALPDLQSEGVLVVAEAQLIFDVFSQGICRLPNWTDRSVEIKECFPTSLEVTQKFHVDTIQVEEALIEVCIKSTHYNV